MRDARGGFALMDRPREEYYDALRSRLGEDALSAAQVEECRVNYSHTHLGTLKSRSYTVLISSGLCMPLISRP